ncbi:MAG: hypothetical protein OEZ34_07290 [Spirochaetia bacterium]|nr:hypothetical protein [Spirochaetia bacterium]
MKKVNILQNTGRCQECQFWIDRGGQNLGWCVSEKIAVNFEEFQSDQFMCQCENIRTQMDDTYIITGMDFGCIHHVKKA